MNGAPGVRIEYLPSQSLSISTGAAMSVPALIGSFHPRETGATCVRIDSWAEFKSVFYTKDDFILSVEVISSVKLPGPSKTASLSAHSKGTQEVEWEYSFTLSEEFTSPLPTPSIQSIHSVELYFLNGGGTAYIISLPPAPEEGIKKKNKKKSVSFAGYDKEALASLPSIIQSEPEISLLVWCGEQASKSAIYEALAELINGDNLPYFLLTDVADNKESPVVTENANVGIWSPCIQKRWEPLLPGDESIRIDGYQDNEEDRGDITLDTLAEINQKLYTEITQAIQERFSNTNKMLEQTLTLSPTPVVAAQFAKVEKQRGIWWSPAGMDVTLQGLSGLSVMYNDHEHAALNERGINAIRNFQRPTSGYRLFGARTQGLNDDWRYINVRRLYHMLIRDIGAAIQKKVFSPNTSSTWNAVSQAITSYLDSLWRRGGLAGLTASQAFDVKVGLGVTMSSSDILNGIMHIDVKFAAVRPAEFIVLRFSQMMGDA